MHVSKSTMYAAQDEPIWVRPIDKNCQNFYQFFLCNDNSISSIMRDAEATLRVFIRKFYDKNNLRSINFCLDNVLYEI